MGRFGTVAALDDEFVKALVNPDARTCKAVAKGQATIRAALWDGEPVRAIAVDEHDGEHLVVVAGRRLLVLRRRGRSLDRALDITDLDVAFLAAPDRGRHPVSLDGAGVTIRFRDPGAARAIATTINDTIRALRPRAVPTLYPGYFAGILSATGVPATLVNVARLVERTAAMVGGQGAAYCGQGADPRAFREFAGRFAHDLQGNPHVVDQMVDWLWAWSPGCHRDLTRRIQQWREQLLGPGSFLTGVTEVPPWADSGSADSTASLWGLVFDRNARKQPAAGEPR